MADGNAIRGERSDAGREGPAEAIGKPGGGAPIDKQLAETFRLFADQQAAKSSPPSPLYTALSAHVSHELEETGPGAEIITAILAGKDSANLLLAAVHRVLLDHPDDALAEYYPSLGGRRLPDAELPKAFDTFLAGHRARIAELMATKTVQTNDVLRSAQLLPAFGWAQAYAGRPLGLIEIGPSAGLLLHADRYAYRYEFADGSQLAGGTGHADGVPILRCEVTGSATANDLAPLVGRDIQVASRVGLDVDPLDPADPEARDWLRALVWPEHTERRERLEGALHHAARHPVVLREGDGLRLLPDALESVPDDAIPCVFSSSCLAHVPDAGRAALVELIREIGARRDLVFIMKESHRAGLGLFTASPDPVPDTHPDAGAREVLASVVHVGGQERIVRLGTAGRHGLGLDWAPTPV